MKLKAILILATLVTLAASTVAAHDGTSHGEQPRPSEATAKTTPPDGIEEKARSYFTDLPVVTQDGTELRFFSDVLKDRVVLISLFYTNCTGMCPLNNQRLAEVQGLLGSDMGRTIFIVSVTLDPVRDTPEVLRDYAAQFGAKDGWMFLTGKKQDLAKITDRLGQANLPKETHNPYLMIGNVGIARWSKIAPNVPAEVVVARLRQMAEHTANN
jgi:cytochrome oxidase Cu insertion factor (SCO1/SenC/PrrC family)